MNQYLITIAISFVFIIGLMINSDLEDGIIEDNTYTIILFLVVGLLGIITWVMIRHTSEQEEQIKKLKEDKK